MPSYTSDVMITRVREWPSMPDAVSRFTDQNILDFMNDEMYAEIVPIIRQAKEDFLVRNTDQTITSTTYDYDLPTRAAGASVYDVVSTNASEANPNAHDKLQRVPFGERSVNYDGYLMNGSKLTLIDPSLHNGRTLRMFYVARPNLIVLTTRGGKITDITGNVLTIDTDLSSIITTNDTVDLVQGNPHFDWVGIDQSITAIDATTVTLSAVPSGLAVNDYVTLNQETLIPQLPVEAHMLLAQGTVLKCLEAIKDRAGYELAMSKFDNMKKDFLLTISPRSELSPRKVNSRNTFLSRRNLYY